MIEALNFFQTRKNNIACCKNSSALRGMVRKERKNRKEVDFCKGFTSICCEENLRLDPFLYVMFLVRAERPTCKYCRTLCINYVIVIIVVLCVLWKKFPLRIGPCPVRRKVLGHRERIILFTTNSLVVYSTILFVSTG